jgi:hypothetical protein
MRVIIYVVKVESLVTLMKYHHIYQERIDLHLLRSWSEMILNYYRVIVERYPFSNGVVGSLIPAVTSSL